MAIIGKTVIHPGGRASTQALLARARITAASQVLDVGCGVATTAIEIARRFGAHVDALDIAPLMLERAEANVRAANVTGLARAQAVLGWSFETWTLLRPGPMTRSGKIFDLTATILKGPNSAFRRNRCSSRMLSTPPGSTC